MSAARRTASFLVFLLSSAGVAAGFSLALWEWFPYADFGRTSLEDRFFLWEAVVWLAGLVLILFGTGAALGTLHLINTRIPPLEEVHTFSHTRLQRRERFSFTGVWMIVTGCVLLALATWARVSLL